MTQYCVDCVVPSSSAIPLTFNGAGVCSGCLGARERADIDWDARKDMFLELVEPYRNPNGYDCIIPVSGGKDSYYQVHLVKEVCGLNPLLVTYNGNNYTGVGLENVQNMREVFGADHIFFTPSIDTLVKLNRIGFKLMGDMNWHAHAGIFVYPARVAVEKHIPLMFWGEHGFRDIGGMGSYTDMVEMTDEYLYDSCLHGYDWGDMVGTGLEPRDLLPWQYPSVAERQEVGMRGIFMSNYFKWEANEHGQMVVDRYGFKPYPGEFERTHRKMSNLDDMHENGVHDYMKYIKFGYGRATDHCCKDIRAGIMSREEAIEIVRARDHIKPRDLYRWLDYVGMKESKFEEIANTFRNPSVWNKQGLTWTKDNLWDAVTMPKEKVRKRTYSPWTEDISYTKGT